MQIFLTYEPIEGSSHSPEEHIQETSSIPNHLPSRRQQTPRLQRQQTAGNNPQSPINLQETQLKKEANSATQEAQNIQTTSTTHPTLSINDQKPTTSAQKPQRISAIREKYKQFMAIINGMHEAIDYLTKEPEVQSWQMDTRMQFIDLDIGALKQSLSGERCEEYMWAS